MIFPTRQVRTDKTNNIAQIKLKSAKGHIANNDDCFLQYVLWRIFIVASNAQFNFFGSPPRRERPAIYAGERSADNSASVDAVNERPAAKSHVSG